MSPTRLGRIESAMRTVLQFNDAFNRHDVEAMMRLMSEECVFENPSPAPNGTVFAGKSAVKHFWEGFFSESPDAKIMIEEIFGMGDRCIMRWIYRWGESREKHVRGVDVFRVKDGLILEKLSYVKG